MKREGFFEAIAILVGTVIGAGVLGIPYVVSRTGIIPGLILIFLLGGALLLLFLYLGEIILRTKGTHQLTGYAQKYLGKWGKRAMAFSMVFGIYGALIAYLIGIGESLHAIFGVSALTFSLLYFLFAAVILYIGLKSVKKWELLLAFLFLGIIFLITSVSSFEIKLSNLMFFNWKMFFLPYGVILFAFLGTAALPEMKQVLIKQRKKFKKAIIIGGLIPILTYAIFTLVVVGVTGLQTTEISTIGLGESLGESMVIFGNLFAIFAMGSSFLILGLALKHMYHFDYKLNHKLSWFLSIFIPLIIFLLGAKSFISVIGITGAVAGGVDGVVVALMYRNVNKIKGRKPEYKMKYNKYLIWFLIIVFGGGIVYTLFSLL